LNRVVLFLDSAGGQVEEGDRVIEALNEIKLRHQLITVVAHAKLCAPMCIPIFLQGEDRLAVRASVWIFHEAAQRQANGQQRTDTRRRCGCSANTTPPPGSQCIGSKVSRL
jgi:ATP-dependent protease ClpP protease subunit